MLRRFNDTLALVLLAGVIPALWVLDGRGYIELPETVAGGLVAAFTLVVQFYFRKAPPKE